MSPLYAVYILEIADRRHDTWQMHRSTLSLSKLFFNKRRSLTVEGELLFSRQFLVCEGACETCGGSPGSGRFKRKLARVYYMYLVSIIKMLIYKFASPET